MLNALETFLSGGTWCCLSNAIKRDIEMAQKKDFFSVEGSAFLVASAGNIYDYEDAKAVFKQQLQKAEKQTTNDAEKLRIYKEAVKGFLMELNPLAVQYHTDWIKRVQQQKALIKECGTLTGLSCIMGLLATMMTVISSLCLIKLLF